MKTFFPIIGDEKRDKIYRSKMLSWIAIASIFFLSLYRPDFQWMVNWLILPFVLMMTFIDFSTFLLFKNHVINDDKTIQQSEEFKEIFSRDNMKKIIDATENSYYYEVKSISNAITFSILLILDYHFFAFIIGAFFIYEYFVIIPFIKNYIEIKR